MRSSWVLFWVVHHRCWFYKLQLYWIYLFSHFCFLLFGEEGEICRIFQVWSRGFSKHRQFIYLFPIWTTFIFLFSLIALANILALCWTEAIMCLKYKQKFCYSLTTSMMLAACSCWGYFLLHMNVHCNNYKVFVFYSFNEVYHNY